MDKHHKGEEPDNVNPIPHQRDLQARRIALVQWLGHMAIGKEGRLINVINEKVIERKKELGWITDDDE